MASQGSPASKDAPTTPDSSWRAMRTGLAADAPASPDDHSKSPAGAAGVLKVNLPGNLYMAVKLEPELTMRQVLETIGKKRSVDTTDTYFQHFEAPDGLPVPFETKMGDLRVDKIRLVELKAMTPGALIAMLRRERELLAAKTKEVERLQAEAGRAPSSSSSSSSSSAAPAGSSELDAQLAKEREAKAALEARVQTLEARVRTLESDLSAAAAKAAAAAAQPAPAPAPAPAAPAPAAAAQPAAPTPAAQPAAAPAVDTQAVEQLKAELSKSQADFDALRKSHSSLQESKSELSAFIERSEAENQELTSLVSRLEEELAAAKQSVAASQSGTEQEAQLAEARAQVAALTADLDTIKTLSAGTLAEYETLFQEAAALRTQLESANAELEQTRAKRSALERQLSMERERTENAVKEKAAQIDELSKANASGAGDQTAAQEKAALAEMQASLIETHKQRVDALEKEVSDKETQIQVLAKNVADLKVQVELLEREKREHVARIAVAQKEKAELEQLKKESRGRDMKRMMIERESEAMAEDKEEQLNEMKDELEELRRELRAARAKEKVTVKVLEARNFRAGGKSDPFIELGIKGQPRSTYRTQVLKKNFQPVWNEEFTFFPEHHEKDALWVKLMDWDIGKNEMVGEVELPLGLFYRRQPKEDWHTFRTGSTMLGLKGEVKLQVSYGFDDESELSELKAKLAAAQAEIETLRKGQAAATSSTESAAATSS